MFLIVDSNHSKIVSSTSLVDGVSISRNPGQVLASRTRKCMESVMRLDFLLKVLAFCDKIFEGL